MHETERVIKLEQTNLESTGHPSVSSLCLLHVKEKEHLANDETAGGIWIGAHPKLGEYVSESLFDMKRVTALGEVSSYRREVSKVCGTDMRTDFLLTHIPSSSSTKVTTTKSKNNASSSIASKKRKRSITHTKPTCSRHA